MVELVGGGSDINGATLSSFSVSVLLLASVERFGVSHMRDFWSLDRLRNFLPWQKTPCNCVIVFSGNVQGTINT